MICIRRAVPDDLDFTFGSIRNPSDQELASILQQKSAAIKDAYAANIISQKTALREYRKLGDETGVFATITDEDVDRADDTTGMGPGEMDLFGAGAPQETPVQAVPEPAADDDSNADSWKTINGAKVDIENGKAVSGPPALKSAINRGGQKNVAKSNQSSKMNSNRKPPKDSNGVSYQRPRAKNVSPKEHAKLEHEINTIYHAKFDGETEGLITTYSPDTGKAYDYRFECHGFNEYNIYSKRLNRK